LTAVDLLARLQSLGIGIVSDNGRLRVSAARGQLTDELKAAITSHKAELLTLAGAPGQPASAEVEPVARHGAMPLSPFQERLWAMSCLEPQSTAYNLATVWPSEGPVAMSRVVEALRAVVARHEILRATFREAGGVPGVEILPAEAVVIETHDVRARPAAEQQAVLRAAVAAATATPFDLAAQPPVRLAVYQVAGERVATLVALHHIVADAWSIHLLEQEVAAACAGRAVPAPRVQYADYVAWKRRTEDARAVATDLDWWAGRLAGLPDLCAFPADREPAGVASGAAFDFAWSRELSESIRAMARAQGATVYMALLAACATVLQRHTGQDDLVLGSPMGTRELAELEGMIGPFINLLVLRLDVADDPPFAELVRRAREAVLDAHAHGQAPFEKLIERLKPARSFTHSPLFQVAVVEHNAPAQGTRIFGGGATHELTWYVREVDGCLAGTFEYRADLYSAALIGRIAAQLETVLRAAVADSGRRVSALPLLTAGERQAVVADFNATELAVAPGTFVTWFEAQVGRTPAACAVRMGGAALTYEALNRRANQVAHYLRGLGVGPGALAVVCLPRSLELVVALLGVQKAGGAYVPLDPTFPAERLGYMLADSGATVLVTAGEAMAGVEVPAGVRRVDLGTDGAALAALSGANGAAGPGAADPAYVIYTSGSTGRPKGVVVSHGGLANFLASMQRDPGLDATDVLAAVTTISFDIAGLELYLPLMVGAQVELVAHETAADGLALASQLDACGATVLQATPATWRLLVEAEWAGRPALRALCGGEALPRDLADAILARTAALWNLYGPTETTIWSTLERVERGDGPITIGRPIANTQVYVLDRHGEPLPVGVPGELWIGGAGVALGYHGRLELTAERFVADRLGRQPGGRIYRTGDLARWRTDGRLEHLGRLDNQVKIRGFRIELGEIEAALTAHPAIKEAAVVAREAGPGDTRLVAYVVYQPGEDLTVSDVRRHLRQGLPDYMIPSVVVALDAMPLTPNRKVDRNALPNPYGQAARAAASEEPPAPGLEQQLADIWREMLHVDRVGADDNFFELGGHSLLSLRVAAAVEKQIGWRMDPRMLFFQTLRQVAAHASGKVAPEGMATA